MFEFDSHQNSVYAEIEIVFTQFLKKPSFITRFIKSPASTHGIYLYGDVGRGKTTILQALYDKATEVRKKKFHFDLFVAQIFTQMKRTSIENVIKNITADTEILWIDEIQIYDIATAMLVKKMIPLLLKHNIFVLLSGNVAPDDFYINGLNREQFVDFIPYFKEKIYTISLDSKHDYRLNVTSMLPHHLPQYCHLSCEEDSKPYELSFSRSGNPHTVTLPLNQRTWHIERAVGKSVWITFQELCEMDRAFDDYRFLIDAFDTIYLTNVPAFSKENRDACRRFMAFIDILYLKPEVQLYVLATSTFAELFSDDLRLPHARTHSRLVQILRLGTLAHPF